MNKQKSSRMVKAVILMLLISSVCHAQAGWFWLQPLPAGNKIRSVRFDGRLNGIACGEGSMLTRTTDGGQTWLAAQSPKRMNLLGIDLAKGNPSVAVAVGDSGFILRSTNGGADWVLQTTMTGVYFRDFDFASATVGYAVGLGGRIYKTTDAGVTWNQQPSPTGSSFRSVNFCNENYGVLGGDGRVLLTSNGGANWVVQNLTFGPFDQAVGVSQIDTATAYVAAETDSQRGKFFRTTNRGQRWDTTYLNVTFGNGEIVRHMSFGNRNKGIICCDLGTVLRTTNGGFNWSFDSTFIKYYQRSFGIGILWTSTFSDSLSVFVAGGGGNIISSANAGQNWAFQTGGYYDILGSHFLNSNTGWAVGEEGTIQKTTDGGMSWSFYPRITREVLRCIEFINDNTGYIGGDSGVVFKTTNAGLNWHFLSTGTRFNFNDIQLMNASTGYLGGGFSSASRGVVLKTTDGGVGWDTLRNSTSNGIVTCLHFFDEQNGLAGFETEILRTSNGGNSWISVGSSLNVGARSMSFPNANTGIAAGYVERVFKTTDMGLTWAQYPTGIALPLYSVDMVNERRGYAVGNNDAIIYTTTGGENWVVQNGLSTNLLLNVNLTDTLNGYIFGQFGTILKTTTGGITSVPGYGTNIPEEYELQQNYPNPFNPGTTIRFTLPENADIELLVHDIAGRQAARIVTGYFSKGSHSVYFGPEDLASGIYFYSLWADRRLIQTRKCILIK